MRRGGRGSWLHACVEAELFTQASDQVAVISWAKTGSVVKEGTCLLTIYHVSKRNIGKRDTPPIGG
jgi:hypothetical protein